MRNQHHGRVSAHALNHLAERRFALVVQRACRLVQNDQARPPQQHARQHDALPFAAGKPNPPVAQLRVQSLRQLRDELPRHRRLQSGNQRFVRRAGMEPRQILAHRRVQNQRILRHISRLPAPRTKSFLRQRLAVHENLALLRKQKAQQQIDRRRLPRAVAAKQRQNLPAPK